MGRWIPTLTAVVLVAFFFRLGWWQLDRADEKASLQASFDAAAEAPAETLIRYHPVPRFQRVRVQGNYRHDATLLLDNQIHQGRVGVHVITPLDLGDGPLLLVNRGWLPVDARLQVPSFAEPDGRQEVVGLMNALPRPGLELGEVVLQQPGEPQRVPYLDGAALSALLKSEVAPQILLSTDPGDDGLVRQWQPIAMSPDRHRAYAFQWFALAAAVAVLWAVLTFRTRRKQA